MLRNSGNLLRMVVSGGYFLFHNRTYAQRTINTMQIRCLFMFAAALMLNCGYFVDKMALFPTRDDTIVDPSLAREIVVPTKDKKNICCLYLENPDNKKVALYFHGNAENIYQSQHVLKRIFDDGVNVFGVDYRGYGKSTGSPSEKGIYKDGEAALKYVKEHLSYSGENIIIIGRSIGTAVACNTARKSDVGKLILITPISNAYECARAHGLGVLSIIAVNKYDNLSKMKNIHCRLQVIGAADDEVLPIFMSHEVASSYGTGAEIRTVDNVTHNTILNAERTYEYLRDFINK
jgi:pimeloyl-ACP methyl ester carboxylesterase